MQPVVVTDTHSPLNFEGRKRAIHPFVNRLSPTTTAVELTSMLLVKAGYASLAMGVFTLFRPTPVILYNVIDLLKIGGQYKTIVISVLFSWAGLIIFCLMVLGCVLVGSTRIKSRHPLMLHPWALLLLYFDVGVWLSLVVLLYLKVLKDADRVALLIKMFNSKDAIFIVMFVEIGLFCILHYIYASWFIVIELTAIELFY